MARPRHRHTPLPARNQPLLYLDLSSTIGIKLNSCTVFIYRSDQERSATGTRAVRGSIIAARRGCCGRVTTCVWALLFSGVRPTVGQRSRRCADWRSARRAAAASPRRPPPIQAAAAPRRRTALHRTPRNPSPTLSPASPTPTPVALLPPRAGSQRHTE